MPVSRLESDLEVRALQLVLAKDGVTGLLFRGLGTKILSNGMQGLVRFFSRALLLCRFALTHTQLLESKSKRCYHCMLACRCFVRESAWHLRHSSGTNV